MPYIYKSGLQFGINETNIYGGASYVELTQAEYDALSDAEKHNGQIYFITDGNYDFLIVNDSVPVGSIQAYGGISAPTNWLICDGSAVSRTTYKELFEVIGVFFGAGDGVTTFNLPDFRGRVLTGAGSLNSINYELGQQKSAGLPNISGKAGRSYSEYNKGNTSYANLVSGPFYYNVSEEYGTPNDLGTGNGDAIRNHYFDASRANSIYGNSTTVQPNTTVANYIIKAKNPTVTSGQQLQAMELFYPVGSYFETSDSTFNPNVEWGGTWVSTGANIYEEKKLLWTNSNPTAAFNAQTLSLDLTAYDYVEIGARWMTTYDGTTKYQKFSIGNSYGTYLVIPVGANDSVADAQRYNSIRAITINTNGIVFKSGGYYRWSATDQGSSGSYAVPIKIFGIKELTQYKWHRTA